MTEQELKQLILAFENEHVERTRAFDKADKIGQAICAFANDISGNGETGYLFLGVEDDGTISGRRIDDEKWASLGGIKTDGHLLPPPSMSMEKVSLPEGDIVVIKVYPSEYPPIRYKGDVWIRVGPRKCKANEADIHVLTERRARYGKRDEERPCSAAKLSDLDLDLFKAFYLPKAIDAQVIEDDDRTTVGQMAALRFYNLERECPTNLGVLLFAKHPERFIPSAYLQYVRFAGVDNSGDVLQENVFKGPLVKVVQELDVFVKTGPAAVRPVLATAMREDPVSEYSAWALREFLMNAIIHRDYFLGNAPIKFYEYKRNRIEISNPGGLFGRATPDNFPFVNDYRNPLLAEAMKVLGMVNKYNRGIAKANKELEKNGNPKAEFDVNKRTEFRVTIVSNGKSGTIKWHDKPKSGTISGESGTMKSGAIKNKTFEKDEKVANSSNIVECGSSKSGTIKWHDKPESGTINNDSLLAYDIEGQDKAVFEIVSANPGIKKDQVFLHVKTSTRSVQRTLDRLASANKIEYRGSNRTGGWYVKT